MPSDPFSYFVIILGGFAVVCAFRKASGTTKPLSEFEYLGFSAFWGILLFMFFAWLLRGKPELIESLAGPFGHLSAAPNIFLLGLGVGVLGFAIFNSLRKLLRFLERKTPQVIKTHLEGIWDLYFSRD